MKKATALVVILAMVACLFVSCGGSDGIVGCWESTESDGTVLYYEFRDNGTGCISNGKDSAEFSYVAKDGVLTVTYGGTSDDATYSVEGNTLTVTDAQGTTVLRRRADGTDKKQ